MFKPYVLHHFRFETTEFAMSYCGVTFGPLAPAETAAKLVALASQYQHCLRCLYGKRKYKGEQYMIENNYPLVHRVLRPSSFGGNLPPSYRYEIVNGSNS